MKKSILALTALAACAGAYAQSSVVMFGIVDAAVARGTGSVSSRTQLVNSGYNSSRLGFRGAEDLGGGLRAAFHLEAGVSNDDGRGSATSTNNQASGGTPSCSVAGAAGATCSVATNGTQGLTFNRRSTVSLGGNWGELRLGRDYTPQFWNLTVYDPFGTNGVGTNQVQNSNIGGPTNTRASNSITYLWGHGYNATYSAGGSGFHAAAQYYLGENSSGAATSHDGSGAGVRVGYNGGPLSVAGAYSRTDYAAGDISMGNVGGAYEFGAFKLMGMVERDRVGSVVPVTGRGYLVGGSYTVGAGEIRLAYSRYRTSAATSPATAKYALGYVHNLSKRTALYATYAHVNNSGNATQALNGGVTAAGRTSSGVDVGLRHIF